MDVAKQRQVVSVNLTEGTPFSVGGEVHPSMMVPDDASKIVVPTIVLASQDEDVATIKGFEANLKVDKFVDFYNEAPHVSLSLCAKDMHTDCG